MKIFFSARSDVGRVRKNNEDNLFCNGVYMTDNEISRPFFLKGIAAIPSVFAISDGMGGEDCGEFASLMTVQTLFEHFESVKKNSYEAVNDFVRDVNKKLIAEMNAKDIQTGATLALIVIGENSFTAYNLGDSRIYRLENKRLLRITDDHTLAEDMIRTGELTPRKAEHHHYRNVLTRYVGMRDTFNAAPDFYGPFDLEANKKILLCSDGLTDMLSYREIAEIMTSSRDPVNNLVDAALERGGIDNVTCIIIEVEK